MVRLFAGPPIAASVAEVVWQTPVRRCQRWLSKQVARQFFGWWSTSRVTLSTIGTETRILRMSVTLLILANKDEHIVAANIDRWGDVFDEIVVGVDSRSDSAVGAAMIGRVNRLVYVEGLSQFANTDWLLPMASSEWVLLLDSDEVISYELGCQLADKSILGSEADSIALRRTWCWPSINSCLNDEPWRYDPCLRLVRRSAFQVNYPTSELHTTLEIDGMTEFVDSSLIHLDLILSNRSSRSAKVEKYDTLFESKAPGFSGTTNSAYYLPEHRSTQLNLVPTSERNLEILKSAVVFDVDSNEQRKATQIENLHIDSIHQAGISRNEILHDGLVSIEIVSSPTRIIAGQACPIEVRLTNNTQRTLWPRVDGRGVAVGWTAWSHVGDEIATGRGELTVPLRPRAHTLVIAWIFIDAYSGQCSISLDVVDEGRFWFGVNQNVDLEILAAGSNF